MEYLTFDKMITPVLIQVLFWLFAALAVIAGLVTVIVSDGELQRMYGVLTIILGPLAVRIWAEIALVLFKIHETLVEIRDRT